MKTTNEHTPGPWRLEDDELSNGNDVLIGTVDIFRGEDFPCVAEEERPQIDRQADANERLIAAAPDLLAALQGILRITDRNHVAWEAARDAIAKAEGAKSGGPNGSKLSDAPGGGRE